MLSILDHWKTQTLQNTAGVVTNLHPQMFMFVTYFKMMSIAFYFTTWRRKLIIPYKTDNTVHIVFTSIWSTKTPTIHVKITRVFLPVDKYIVTLGMRLPYSTL